ncbi:MAG: DUF1080 domain-containing protein [Planctomycetota bacterium]|nr:DUF1080 domain-containing protein [Planctomycetota bacterium]
MFSFALCLVLAAGGQNPYGPLEGLKILKPADTVDTKSTSAPEGAVVLFNGKSTDAWEHKGGKRPVGWKVTDAGQLEIVGGTGDSYGLDSKDNDCGGIYSVAKPLVNACKAPTVWQAYDIDFTPPVFEGGKKVKQGVISVRQNGVTIHDKQNITQDNTTSGLGGNPAEGGPVLLQDHGNPVQYRNIWLVKKATANVKAVVVPRALVVKDAPKAVVVKDAPKAVVVKDAPKAIVVKDAPKAIVVKDAPKAVVVKDAPKAVVVKDAPKAVVVKDAPKAVVTSRAVVTATPKAVVVKDAPKAILPASASEASPGTAVVATDAPKAGRERLLRKNPSLLSRLRDKFRSGR